MSIVSAFSSTVPLPTWPLPRADDVALLTPERLARYSRAVPRYTSYPTAADFDGSVDPQHYAQRLRQLGGSDNAVGVYLHLPFCEARCTYCACNVTVSRLHDRVSQPYLRRMVREFEMVSEQVGRKLSAKQLHLGGGTPTYHSPAELAWLLQELAHHVTLEPGAESSVEVDPRVTSTEHLQVLDSFGFRRLSIGVQDLDEVVQRSIGRLQSFQQTAQTIETARSLGFTSINVDLVYGLPHQTEASFAETLRAVLALRPDRLAVYGFAYLPSRMKHQQAIDAASLPDAPARHRLLMRCRETLLGDGYDAIGFDHFALPTDSLVRARESGRLGRNFMGYTEVPCENLLAFGASSIGHVMGAFVQNHTRLVDYQRAIDNNVLPTARGVVSTPDDSVRAWVVQELLCNGRVEKEAFKARWDVPFDARFATELTSLRAAWPELIVELPGVLRLSPLGEMFARTVACAFDARRDGRGASWKGAAGV